MESDSAPRNRAFHLQGVLEMLINLHDSRLVTTPVAVVGRCIGKQYVTKRPVKALTRENSYDVPILRPVVTLHDKLVSSRHQGQTVVVVERLRNVLTKGVTSTTGRYSPATPVIRV